MQTWSITIKPSEYVTQRKRVTGLAFFNLIPANGARGPGSQGEEAVRDNKQGKSSRTRNGTGVKPPISVVHS